MAKIGPALLRLPALAVAAAVLLAPAPALADEGEGAGRPFLVGSLAGSPTVLVLNTFAAPDLLPMDAELKRQPTDFIDAVDQVIADCSRFVADYVPTRPGWRSGPVLGVSLSHKLLPVFFTGPEE